MRVDDIRRLIELVEQSDIGELEVRRLWSSIRISKSRMNHGQVGTGASQGPAVLQPWPGVSDPPAVVAMPGEAGDQATASGAWGSLAGSADIGSAAGQAGRASRDETEAGLVPIVSPMVGTFYQAPSPQASAYLEVGGRVESGQVVCIIEAMKLMNEIEAEVSGTVVRALVKNEEPVEYNQPLYLVRPD
jgi:acetyl-CoA carboxylase biotin carboxyl carrier protein